MESLIIADRIMSDLREFVANGSLLMPPCWSALHEQCDANMFVEPYFVDERSLPIINAALEIVDALLPCPKGWETL